MTIVIQIINLLGELIILIVIVWAVLSWLTPPTNNVRRFLDRFIEPALAPIRRVVPTVGGVDFSPLVLIIVVQVIVYILNQVFLR